MADPSPDSDIGTPGGQPDIGGGGRSAPPATPRWVKVAGIVVVVLVALVVVMLLLGHGPAQHIAAAVSDWSAPTGVAMVLPGPGARR